MEVTKNTSSWNNLIRKGFAEIEFISHGFALKKLVYSIDSDLDAKSILMCINKSIIYFF